MKKPVILCVDDQRDVLAMLMKDLHPFAQAFDLLDAESAADANRLLDDLSSRGTPVAIVVADHVMPGQTGIDFLASLRDRPQLHATRRLLLTGLATHDDTIRAINQAALDRYIAKPWRPDALNQTLRELATAFVLDQYPDDYKFFFGVLDRDVMVHHLRRGGDR